MTDVFLNDGLWHHVCVSWENSKGVYQVYVDAFIAKNGTALARNTEIKGKQRCVINSATSFLLL